MLFQLNEMHRIKFMYKFLFLASSLLVTIPTSATFVAMKHRRTEVGRRSNVVASSATSLNSSTVPSLIVFDLDNTLWTPELYQLRKLQRSKQYPVANKDVKLFPGAKQVIQQLLEDPHQKFANTKFAIASRTQSVEWAHDLLEQFDLLDLFDFIEIFPGNKKQHFSNLKSRSGIDYDDMLFFDDSRDGKYGNCEPVAALGVLSVHCPNGIYEESVFSSALTHFENWSMHRTANTIIEWDNTVTTGKNSRQAADPKQRYSGEVKYLNRDKRFGFITYGDRNTKDMFFHFSSLPDGKDVEEGDKLSFTIVHDSRKGKDAARNIILSENKSTDKNSVTMRVFSMNLPFAALLSNGYKTLETRNGTMFVPYPEGTKMLLHVGQRTYPDGDRHIDVMKSGGLADEEIEKLKTLPSGFSKGMAIAIVELGRTFETTLEERCDPDFQRSVGAFGADSGMRVTEIKRVEYLKHGVKVTGRGGVFKANIDKSVIPDGWLE